MEQCFKMINEGPVTPENPERYFEEKGLLYRKILMNTWREGESLHKLLIIPSKYRQKIIEEGHAGTFSGHLGITRTKQRISQNFYWPKMGKRIKAFCQSCDICQRQGNSNDKSNSDEKNSDS